MLSIIPKYNLFECYLLRQIAFCYTLFVGVATYVFYIFDIGHYSIWAIGLMDAP